MKKLVVFIILIMSAISTFAVKYHTVGSNAEFCVYKFDGSNFLILCFKDTEGNKMPENALVKFKLNDGSVIKLEGFNGSKSSTTTNYVNWDFGSSTERSREEHYAIFIISSEDIERLKIGVDKVAISTIPEVYFRSKWSGKDA
ncbi:MAG: hypothetical protein K5856_05775, partial [Bacteroidaceae bacterium]|nr:hypothetical protein [Bacteroidaceae bacterium]